MPPKFTIQVPKKPNFKISKLGEVVPDPKFTVAQ